MSIRRRAIRARVERDERLAKGHAEFKAYYEAISALIARKQAAGEKTITHQEIAEATRMSPLTGSADPNNFLSINRKEP